MQSLKNQDTDTKKDECKRCELRDYPDYMPEGKSIYYRETMEEFFEGFREAGIEPADAYAKVKDIWKEEGFLDPTELETKLYQSLLKDATPEKKRNYSSISI